ncbi:DUF4097 family beta strand repeat-containing protein [Peptostreptococcaceae bacterium AGR-M142]
MKKRFILVFFILFLISALMSTLFFKFAGVKTDGNGGEFNISIKTKENITDYGKTYTYDVKEVESISVKTQSMPITIKREDRKDILVIIESEKDNNYDVITQLENKTLKIEIDENSKNQIGFLELNDVDIIIPNNYELKSIHANSITGYINTADVGNLNISNTSGNIDIENGYDDLIVTNVSGYISIGGEYSKINANNVAGEIELESDIFDEAILNTVSGNIELYVSKDFSANYYFSTISGKTDFDIENNYKKINKNQGIIGEYKEENKNDFKITVKTVTGEFNLNNN